MWFQFRMPVKKCTSGGATYKKNHVGFMKQGYHSFVLRYGQIHVTGAGLYNAWDLC